MDDAPVSTPTSAASSATTKARGPGYTNVEDLIVARAFIAASENAICGAHQKGRVFKKQMFDIYTDFTKDHVAADKELLENSSHATHEEYTKKGVGSLFPGRSADSIFNRFKGQIAPEVMKYMGVVETTQMSSGWNADDHKAACLELFKQRYGHPFDFYTVYDYLKDRNKFSSFRTKIEEDELGKRPLGKKKSRQAEVDAKIVKAVVSEVFVKQEAGKSSDVDNNGTKGGVQGMGDLMQNISEVIANVGTALLENMKAEQDMRMVQSLDTPDRKAYAKEQMALRMAESRDKRRRLEQQQDYRQEGKGDSSNNNSSSIVL
ncbi:hypothetical protein MHU86_23567 [Fragilaria crotonensis]|nr:hypothetical protein MHU86_23567 [Fragilaria crotonensis]